MLRFGEDFSVFGYRQLPLAGLQYGKIGTKFSRLVRSDKGMSDGTKSGTFVYNSHLITMCCAIPKGSMS